MSQFIKAPCSGELCEETLIDACSIMEINVSRGNLDPEIYIVNVKTPLGTYEWSRSATLDSAEFIAQSLTTSCNDCCKKECC